MASGPNTNQGYGHIQPGGHTVTSGKPKKHRIKRGGLGAKRGKRIGTPRDTPGNPPVDPNQALIDAMTRLRFGGEDLALAQQRTNIEHWFPQYQQRIADAAKASQAFYQGLQQGNLQAQAQAGQGPNFGPGVSADVQAESQLAGASRAGMVGQFGQALGAASGAENTFLQNQSVVGAAAQLGQQVGNQQAAQQLAAQKGQYAIEAKSKIEADIQKQQLEQQLFGLNQAKAVTADQNTDLARKARARESRRNRASQEKRARAQQRAKAQEVNKYGYSNEQWGRFSPSHRQRVISEFAKKTGANNGEHLTPKEARDARVNFRRAVADVKRNPSMEQSSLYDQMVQAGYDPVVARAAVQLVRKGRVGPNTAKALQRDYGIKPPRGRPHPVLPAQPRPPNAPDAGGGMRPT